MASLPRAKGVVFVPASGRSKAGMFSSMGELGEDLKRDGAPFVCMNGLTVSFFCGRKERGARRNVEANFFLN